MKLLVSRCLLGEPCRYDGRVKTDLRAPLRAAGIGDDCWISVCPESDGGLPTPRTPSEIRGTARGVLEGRDHIMAADGRDNTACFMKGARPLPRERRQACAPQGQEPLLRLRPGLRRHLYGHPRRGPRPHRRTTFGCRRTRSHRERPRSSCLSQDARRSRLLK